MGSVPFVHRNGVAPFLFAGGVTFCPDDTVFALY